MLLLDEPTASLDVANRDGVIDLIRQRRDAGAAIVGIFHDVAVRDALATRQPQCRPCPERKHEYRDDPHQRPHRHRRRGIRRHRRGARRPHRRRSDEGRSNATGAIDLEGDYLVPGLVELHTDNLEKHFAPRPGVKWPAVPALMAHDTQIAAAGITTVFDSLALGDVRGDTDRVQQHARAWSRRSAR